MDILIFSIFLLLLPLSIVSVIDAIYYIASGERLMGHVFLSVASLNSIVLGPLAFFLNEFGQINDCCTGSAFFSPDHRISILMISILSAAAYFYSFYRKKLRAPLVELLVNCFLLIGVVLNVLMIIHDNEGLWLIGNVPVIALFPGMLIKNHLLLREESMMWTHQPKNLLSKACRGILESNVFIKFPLLLILCLPILTLVSAFLFVFGQKPDSIIRAFTETYMHGLSQWDYQCENVECGEHYLCSVAANGHPAIVKPVRRGHRNGGIIMCNRQLLVSNAFEELVSQKFPRTHRWIRRNYDQVGTLVHRHYHVFSNKFFSDLIYLLMKPLEYMFLFTLYIADRNPENRISLQYLPHTERIMILELIASKNKKISNGKNA